MTLKRKLAIKIIEQVIEPLISYGLNGVKYYETEDKIVEIMSRNK